jgi:hypothetical protein
MRLGSDDGPPQLWEELREDGYDESLLPRLFG